MKKSKTILAGAAAAAVLGFDRRPEITHYEIASPRLPEDFRGIIEHEGTERAATDYISGMTDGYAMEKYGELFIPFAWTVK